MYQDLSEMEHRNKVHSLMHGDSTLTFFSKI